ncbi:MAG: hypothetical protein B5M48_01185 [Candidatus Omnitrophica bacterium 4484_213]|nr:AbrB/MazE/SpoVT family DNA-binding domain-containing protein [Candidatus Omnitrophota bacterium]OQX54354.1 MAG: hypothetical protein B5M48_01185 [Candidatus Omnitrophica bacterium 4484_213]
MTVTVSSRGQMVIPSEIRKKYRISPYTKIELVDLGNEIVIVPIPKKSFSSARGVLKGVSTQDLIKERRKERRAKN